MRLPGAALAVAIPLLLGACTPAGPGLTRELAADQTLRVAIPVEVSLDPIEIQHDLEYSIAQNLFGGLYRFDERLREVPDLAAAMPDVSADGLVYTIKLRPDARFWDGRPVTSADVLYSWNRAVDDPNSAWSSIFQPVAGYQEVQDSLNAGKPVPLRGLAAPDAHTVVVTLSAPAGYFLTTLAHSGTWIVNQVDIEANGRDWSDVASAAVGTGPFRVTSRFLGHSTTLVPVEHWWGGPTGWLKKVVIDVVPDGNAARREYLQGRFDLVGLGGFGPQGDGTIVGQSLAADPGHAAEVHTYPYGRTEWLAFDVRTGPLAGAEGLPGRRALSLAIDRVRLARSVCGGGLLCAPATGGWISKGLAGYLGDGSDPLSAFDVKTARADLQQWDPQGTKRRGLTYVYTAIPLFRQVADNLREQWKANLGIDVRLQGYEDHTYFHDQVIGDYILFRGHWAADYDSPQDWFDTFIGDPNTTGSGYSDPSFLAVVAKADASSGATADSAYREAGRMLLDQAILAPLYYYRRAVVFKPYVDGFGASALYAYPLTDIKILQH